MSLLKVNPAITWCIEGPFDSTYSLALVNRELARALNELCIVVVVLHSIDGDAEFTPSAEFLDRNLDLKKMTQRTDSFSPEFVDVTSRNLYPPLVSDMCSPINLLHSYAWEETTFPLEWVRGFNEKLNGIACTSTHVKQLLQNSGVCVPITVIGNGVDHWQRVIPDEDFSIERNELKEFKFLHVSSCFPRKGPEALLDAYEKAFSSMDDVSLVIKTVPNPHNLIHDLIKERKAKNPNYPHIVVIEEDFSDEALKALYEECQVLVAPSCAEGFGLPLAEAMLSGLPVITTAWSGQMDFCNDKNSWLVDFNFEQANTHFNLLPSAWASIDVDALSESMQVARSTPASQRLRMAENGKLTLTKNFTWKVVAERLISFYEDVKNKKLQNEPLVGWVTTWNVKCGIATYSKHVTNEIELKHIILAAKDNHILNADDGSCRRCWSAGDEDHLLELELVIDEENLGVLVIQFNFGFFHHESLTRFITLQKMRSRIVVIEMHSTINPPHAPHKLIVNYISALKMCDRVLVHTIDDMNQLKRSGLVDNVALFPHGILTTERSKKTYNTIPTIATYGFCLPHKGLLEVLHALVILRDSGKVVNLKMINSEYPDDISARYVQEIRDYINKFQLKSQVFFESNFLDDEASLEYLNQSDLILYVYKPTSESASGAIRYGLASGKPTLCTNLPIFKEFGDAVWRISDSEPQSIADGIWTTLVEIEAKSDIYKRKDSVLQSWRNQHSFKFLSERLNGLILSLYNG